MAYNQNNTVYQHQIGFGTKVYRKVTIANSGSKSFAQKPVSLVSSKQPTESNNFFQNNCKTLPTDVSKRLLNKPKNEATIFSKTINRTTAGSVKTPQKPVNRLSLTPKNRIPLRKQLKPNEVPTVLNQQKNNTSPKLQIRTGTNASNVASSAMPSTYSQLRNRIMTIRKQSSKHNISATPINPPMQKTKPQSVKTVVLPKVITNQASGDHNQAIPISRKEIPPVRLTAVVNITQNCSEEPATIGTVLTEVPASFIATVLDQSKGESSLISDDAGKTLVTRKKFVVNSKPGSSRTEERQKGGNENISLRQRRSKAQSVRPEETEVKQETVPEVAKFSELGVQTNENEITNHSLLVGDSRYISPSASVIAEIEKTRKEQKTKELLNIARKFSETNQRQEQHIDNLNEFLQQSYITKKPRKVPDMFEADRK